MELVKMKLCKCGCGKEVTNLKSNYIYGHYQKTTENRSRVSLLNKGKISVI